MFAFSEKYALNINARSFGGFSRKAVEVIMRDFSFSSRIVGNFVVSLVPIPNFLT